MSAIILSLASSRCAVADALQHVLVARLADAPADAHVLERRVEHRDAGNAADVAPQLLDHALDVVALGPCP
jgi:hypothetical protein